MKKPRRLARPNPVARALRAPGSAFRKRAERLRKKYRRRSKRPTDAAGQEEEPSRRRPARVANPAESGARAFSAAPRLAETCGQDARGPGPRLRRGCASSRNQKRTVSAALPLKSRLPRRAAA